MKIQGNLIKTIVSENGMFLTQSDNVEKNERVFSSKVYGEDMSIWTEWTKEQMDEFLESRKDFEL